MGTVDASLDKRALHSEEEEEADEEEDSESDVERSFSFRTWLLEAMWQEESWLMNAAPFEHHFGQESPGSRSGGGHTS